MMTMMSEIRYTHAFHAPKNAFLTQACISSQNTQLHFFFACQFEVIRQYNKA